MVFISYKSEDVNLANRVNEALTNNGIDVWMAPKSIPGGSNYAKEIPSGIENCDAVVLVLTEAAQESAWIPSELGLAKKDNKVIIPVVYKEISLTKEFEFLIINYQQLVIDADTDEPYSVLVERIRQIQKENDIIENSIHNSDRVETSWGPQDRKTYNWNDRADCVTFNSITNNPYIGDERNFVRVKKVDAEGYHSDSVDLEPNTEYQIYIYFNNDAKSELNKSGAGVSLSTYVRTRFPSYLNAGESAVVVGFLTARNATPNEVWDACYLNALDRNYYINYVPNSAILHHFGEPGTADGTGINGKVLLGEGSTSAYWDDMWGMLPAGEEYCGCITYRLMAATGEFAVISEASKDEDNWHKIIDVTPGETIYFRLKMINYGGIELVNSTMHDDLNCYMEYVDGSCWACSSRHPEGGKSPDCIHTSGLGVGAIIHGEETYATYKIKISDNVPVGTTMSNEAYVATHLGKVNDKVVIHVV